ncbi:MAG: hypothetical protein HY763_06715 [Planctomycetes bacterium]|nr:hypothetical protein [Planctomycetota bacterium]
MIRREDVIEVLQKQPFEPFRICMTDGRTYEVRHPDLCVPSRSTVYVGVPDPKLRRTVVRMDQCAYVHIVRFEPLNGNETRRGRGRKQ